LLLLPALALAQAEVERFDRTLEQIQTDQRLLINPDLPITQRTFIDYGGYTDAQWISFNDYKGDNIAFWQEDLVGYFHAVLDGANEVFFRGRLFHRDFNPGDRFNTSGEDVDGYVERAFYRFDLAQYESAYEGKQIDGDLSIKLGRDLVIWGDGLTLNEPLDAGVFDLSKGSFSAEMIAGVTPLNTVDFDSSRPSFDTRTSRGLYGGIASVRIGEQKPFVFVLDQRDYNKEQILASATDTSIIPTRFSYNSHYIGIGSTGALTDRLSYGVEGVYEGGNGLSNSYFTSAQGFNSPATQTRDPIQAYAMDARLDYVIPGEHATRLGLDAILASGDHDRNSTTNTLGGNKPGSKDRAFNAFGLLNVGVAFAPPLSNLIALRMGASTFPLTESNLFSHLQVGTDLFLFGKANSDAPIDEPSNDNTYLGFEPDLYFNWGITSDVTLATRYGIFVPGDGIAGDHKIRQFLYTGLTFSF
jgi:hypothetical protein